LKQRSNVAQTAKILNDSSTEYTEILFVSIRPLRPRRLGGEIYLASAAALRRPMAASALGLIVAMVWGAEMVSTVGI
jgi:hypothetical protein